jgi:putative glutamine amidotransferase
MLPGYMDAIRNSGGLPIMLPLTSDKTIIKHICRMVDGLLFTGGQDIYPGLYGCEENSCCGPVCSERDDMEALLFTEAAIELDMPVFGICRGLQLFNIMLDGTLYQDLPSQFKSKISIKHQQEKSDNDYAHSVIIRKSSPLYTLIDDESIEVNSTHHQGICELSKHLECMAYSEDGLVEAVHMLDRQFVWAVQWHPECTLYDYNSHLLFDAFVGACNKFSERK